ncbi:unnamed protein product [Linum trigynum]|uniref:Uncharacterized protein n=1 Tax=Linum trigynum TaxID=586398 RepID=A0AAV2FDW7_9ROSI
MSSGSGSSLSKERNTVVSSAAITGGAATTVIVAYPPAAPIVLDLSATISDPIIVATQDMLNLNLFSPFSISNVEWDLSGVNREFGGSWSDDGLFLLGQTGDCSFKLTDVTLGLGRETIAVRRDASAVGDNLANFCGDSLVSVSSEEGLSIDEASSNDHLRSIFLRIPLVITLERWKTMHNM